MKREIVESGFGGIEIPFVFRNQILKKKSTALYRILFPIFHINFSIRTIKHT